MTDSTPGGRRKKTSRSTGRASTPTTDRDESNEIIVFGLVTGPVHLAQPGVGRSLSVCGVKSQFRHTVRPGTLDDVTCPKCLRLHARGETRTWKA